jgi:hypothetical protein
VPYVFDHKYRFQVMKQQAVEREARRSENRMNPRGELRFWEKRTGMRAKQLPIIAVKTAELHGKALTQHQGEIFLRRIEKAFQWPDTDRLARSRRNR